MEVLIEVEVMRVLVVRDVVRGWVEKIDSQG